MSSLLEWLRQDAHLAIVLSVVFIVAGFLLYVILRRRVGRSGGGERGDIRDHLLLGFGILLLVLIGLEVVWRNHIEFLRDLHAVFRKNEVYANILWTLVAGVVVYLMARAAEHGLVRDAEEIEHRHKIRRAVNWTRTVVFIACVVLIWQSRIQNIGVILGIVGAGVAMSLQEVLLCIVGWMLIVTRKPFDIGDRIEIGKRQGDVIDITVFRTVMLEIGNWVHADQSTGRTISVPNSAFFRNVTFNYTKGFPFIWNELTTVVTFESDWKRAKEIILKQAEKEADKIEAEVRRKMETMQSSYPIRFQHLKPIVYTHIADQGVALTLRYLTPVRKRRGTTHEICEGILDDFAKEPSIDFAYPTTRFYNNVVEGKPGTIPPAPEGSRQPGTE
ncbi:MAG: mechanosensitive ion channel family protein [Planctomycetes bacterium]|nr:mechanosensitive ion channel family protein [Planctomycetota bacterium]